MKMPASAGIFLLSILAWSGVLAAGEAQERVLAVCVGVGNYRHLAEVGNATGDVYLVADALEATGLVRRTLILADTDRDGKPNNERLRPTRNNILSMLTLATKSARADESIIFFYTGRGELRDDAAHIYPFEAKQGGGIALDEIAKRLAAGKAESRIMIIDAGLPADDSSDGVTGPLAVSIPGIVTIASCSEGQAPVVDEDSGRGLFALAFEEVMLAADPMETSVETFVDSMGKFMGDYCLDRFIVEGQIPVVGPGGGQMAFFPKPKEQPAPIEVAVVAEEDDSELEEEIEEPVRPKTSPVIGKAKAIPAPKKTAQAKQPRHEPARKSVVQKAATVKTGDKRIDNLLVQAERQFNAGNFDKALLLFEKAQEFGSAEAVNWIGDMYFEGCGVERDYTTALDYYRQAAEAGLAEAQCNMGYMHYQGLGVKSDYPRARQWLEMSAAQGHPDAYYHLHWIYKSGRDGEADEKRAEDSMNQAVARGLVGRLRERAEQGWSRECLMYATLFEHGFGVDKNEATMVQWEKAASDKGLALAQIYYANSLFNSSGGLTKNNSEAVALYRKAAEQGNMYAQNAMGNFYYNGEVVSKDLAQSAAWLKKAAEQGNAQAQSSLAYLYYNGEGVAQDYAQSAVWYRKAAEQGHAIAQRSLGYRYYHGEGVAKDLYEAAAWLKKAADQGDAVAQKDMGNLYSTGEGVSKDNNQAVMWYRKSAEQGNANAQKNLGNCYYNGDGVAQDYNEAVRWYQKAADQGLASAKQNLGTMYYYGKGVGQDYAQAYRWYKPAAEDGEAYAQRQLGRMYYEAKGVSKDYAEAVKWYKLAAEQGNAEAQNALGFRYFDGEGVAKDYAMAAKWLRAAAEKGISAAQHKLGYQYDAGLGVNKNTAEAIKWYKMAADNNEVKAMYNLGIIYNAQGPNHDHDTAFHYYKMAADRGMAEAMNNLGTMYQEGKCITKNESLALQYYQMAMNKGNQIAAGNYRNLKDGIAHREWHAQQDLAAAQAGLYGGDGSGYNWDHDFDTSDDGANLDVFNSILGITGALLPLFGGGGFGPSNGGLDDDLSTWR